MALLIYTIMHEIRIEIVKILPFSAIPETSNFSLSCELPCTTNHFKTKINFLVRGQFSKVETGPIIQLYAMSEI